MTGLGLAFLVAGLGAGIIELPDLGAQVEQAIQAQIDYEDDTLCQKFGFAPGTQEHTGCKLDLADLRHRHEQLRAASEFP